jgi:DNA-binding MarR family transcriptional regulator
MVLADKNTTDITEQLVFKIHTATMLMKKNFAPFLMQDLDISIYQFEMLAFIYYEKDCNQKIISQCLHLSQAAVSKQIKVLVDKNLLIQAQNDNHRSHSKLLLSAQGKLILDKAMKAVEQKSNELLQIFTQEEQLLFNSMLSRLNNALL